MLDQLRRDIQTRLDELLSETNKLRHALAALTSRNGAAAATSNGKSSPTPSRRQASTTPAPSTPSRDPVPARRKTAAASSTSAASPKAASSPATLPPKDASAPARTAPGTTKTAVLKALAGGTAMTASEVANATGLGRASVSTTLSKLAKTGDVTKAVRGYQITGQTTRTRVAGAAGDAADKQPVA